MSSNAYQPFVISEFKTGLFSYLSPWIRTSDAFEPLNNAYTYRGTINKRNGYSLFGNKLADGNPVMGLMRYVDEATGTISLLAASTVHLYLYVASTNTFNNIASLPSVFTGKINNFFNYTNWQASAGAASIIYMTNNTDPITTYDGSVAEQPTIYFDSAHTVTLTNCLDVVVYKQRLLYILPTLSNSVIPENQTIIWSAIDNPLTLDTDVAGNGGFLAAPTGDVIQSVEFIRDVLIVFFSNSTWIFRYTGNDTNPFRWDKLNNSKSTNAPYGSIDYDERCTSVGATGLIACDANNVQRYDVSIIDYYETNFKEAYYSQTFSQRYDNLNQGWMLYVSQSNEFPVIGGVAPGSDQALVYNFLENSWSTYVFTIPLTCLGTFYKPNPLASITTWAALTQTWASAQFTWNSYNAQSTAPILLAGGTDGSVYYMDDAKSLTDNGTPIPVDILGNRWNPFTSMGEKTQFGFIDIYYAIPASKSGILPSIVTLNFYADNSKSPTATRLLTLDGPMNAGFNFKRIYMNLSGQFIQMEMLVNSSDVLQILGFILWARPAGRFTA